MAGIEVLSNIEGSSTEVTLLDTPELGAPMLPIRQFARRRPDYGRRIQLFFRPTFEPAVHRLINWVGVHDRFFSTDYLPRRFYGQSGRSGSVVSVP
jgi:hypothetical protein